MLNNIQNLVLSVAEKLSWFSPLAARITVGYVFAETGWAKLHSLDKVAGFFAELGIPAPHIQAPFVALVELVCGALVLVGLFTRLAAIPLIGTMIVAIATAKLKQIVAFTDVLGYVEFVYIVVFFWLFTAGPGPVSVDHFLFKERDKSE